MPQQIIRRALSISALAVVSSAFALAQSPAAPAVHTRTAWQSAQLIAPSKGKLFVVTVDRPDRRQTCHIQSFTLDKLVCSHAVGGPHTYLPQQMIAIILPGKGDPNRRFVFGLMGGSAAAVWGTVVLATTCPGCAAVTGIVAFLLFYAGALAVGDEEPDHLLYLASGQQLSNKVGFVEP